MQVRASGATALVVFLALTVFYLATAPGNHATALDSYGFAYWITELPYTQIPELRLFLWLLAMYATYDVVTALFPISDPFVIFGILNSAQTALAVVLLQRLLQRRLGVATDASWITAAAFAVSYAAWRYAAELEIYASAGLISIALCYAAFSLETGDGLRRGPGLTVLGVFGGLASLAYQPIGILAGIAIPVYLFKRLGLRRTMAYLAVSGGVLLAGLAAAYLLDDTSSGIGLGTVFDTDGKPPIIPSLGDVLQAFVAFLQNILSINWGFAFAPTRPLFEGNEAGAYSTFVHAARFAGSFYLIFLLTVPVAGLLLLLAIARGNRAVARGHLGAPAGALVIWLALQALTVFLIDPGGLEAWLPAMFPLFILIGLFIADPLSKAGQSAIAIALVGVMLVHNYFAGIGVLSSGEPDYYTVRAGPVIGLSDEDDLLVVSREWSFVRYLSYASKARNLDASTLPATEVRAAIEQTLEAGGDVFIFDPRHSGHFAGRASESPIAAAIAPLIEPYSDRFVRIDLGSGEAAFMVRGRRD